MWNGSEMWASRWLYHNLLILTPSLTLPTGYSCSPGGQGGDLQNNMDFLLIDSLNINVSPGLPKAAVITHLQSLKAAGGFWAFGATESDVIYIPLPLYHSAASLIGIGGTIELGRSSDSCSFILQPYRRRQTLQTIVIFGFIHCSSSSETMESFKIVQFNCWL